jgi:phage terminase small subunit
VRELNFLRVQIETRGVPRKSEMAGRKPLPTVVKELKGTLQKCRVNAQEPKPVGDLVELPDYMSDGAKSAWRYALDCAPPNLLKKLDMSVLEVWACAADLYRKAQIGIGKTGLLIKAPNTGVSMQT